MYRRVGSVKTTRCIPNRCHSIRERLGGQDQNLYCNTPYTYDVYTYYNSLRITYIHLLQYRFVLQLIDKLLKYTNCVCILLIDITYIYALRRNAHTYDVYT